MSSNKKQLTGHDPELPEHNQSTSNARGSHLGRVNWDGSVLRTDANAHDKACGE